MPIKKEDKERIIGEKFLSLLRQTTGRNLKILHYGDKPDLLCRDIQTHRKVGVEVTESLDSQQGRDRSLSANSANAVIETLKKYAKGGLVAVDFKTKFPENKEQRERLKLHLESSILESGGLVPFARKVDSAHRWEYEGFIISEISVDDTKEKWTSVSDAPLGYQSQTLSDEDLIERVRRKSLLLDEYEKVDDLILVIRNPHAKWTPNKDLKKRIASAKDNRIQSVWVINWKMNRLPVQPDIIRIDQ